MKKINNGGMRIWALLIPRIEEVLEYNIKPEYKCQLIAELIRVERNRK